MEPGGFVDRLPVAVAAARANLSRTFGRVTDREPPPGRSSESHVGRVGGSNPIRSTRRDVRDARTLALVFWRHERHNGAMPSVQIKDVPEEAHAVLRRRAADAHQSLQEYLRSRLIAEASRPTLGEVLDRAGGRAGGSVTLKAAARAVRDDRARR
jgi:antitoxin FitA